MNSEKLVTRWCEKKMFKKKNRRKGGTSPTRDQVSICEQTGICWKAFFRWAVTDGLGVWMRVLSSYAENFLHNNKNQCILSSTVVAQPTVKPWATKGRKVTAKEGKLSIEDSQNMFQTLSDPSLDMYSYTYVIIWNAGTSQPPVPQLVCWKGLLTVELSWKIKRRLKGFPEVPEGGDDRPTEVSSCPD